MPNLQPTVKGLAAGAARVQQRRGVRPFTSQRQNCAVVPALPEPFAVLALMHLRIEVRQRLEPIAADEDAAIAKGLEPGEDLAVPATETAGEEG